MSQVSDYTIDNSTGANVRADINAVLGAIATNNSGSSAQGIQALGFFANTSDTKLQLRNAADNAFVNLRGFDGSLPLPDGSVSSPSLFFDDDTNTGLFSSAADTLNFTTGGVERMELGATTIFNEDGADVDFRIEGDTLANLFYVNAGTDRVGINTDTPLGHLGVAAAAGTSGTTASSGYDEIVIEGGNEHIGMCFLSPAANNVDQTIAFGDSNNNKSGLIRYEHSNDAFRLDTGGSERMRIDSSGRVLIGTTTKGFEEGDDLTIATSTHTGITIRSGTSSLGNIYFADGTSSDSRYRGIVQYNHSGDSMRLYTAATEAIRIDSSQNVGIGTTSPDLPLHVQGTSNADEKKLFRLTNGGGSAGTTAVMEFECGVDEIATISANNAGGDIGNLMFGTATSQNAYPTEKMRIDSSGNVGIGTTSPSRKLEITDATFSALRIKNSSTSISNGTNIAGIEFEHADSSAAGVCAGINALMADTSTGAMHMTFSTGTNVNLFRENMRLDDNGRLLIRETTMADVNANLTVAVGSASLAGITTHSGTTGNRHALACCNDNGHIGGITTSGSTTSFNTSSDYRLKENATAISDGISRLKTLKPYRFNWKVDSSTTVDGFFAHEVTAVPEAITGIKDEVVTQAMIDAGDYEEESLNDPIYQGIDQSKLVPLLVAAVQELIGKVETLEAA